MSGLKVVGINLAGLTVVRKLVPGPTGPQGPAGGLDADIEAALEGAASPSAGNVFATVDDLPADVAAVLTTSGDILYRDGSGLARLAKGSDGQVLTLASGLPSWAAASGGGATPLETYTADGLAGSYTTEALPSLAADEQFYFHFCGGLSTASALNWRVNGNSDANSYIGGGQTTTSLAQSDKIQIAASGNMEGSFEFFGVVDRCMVSGFPHIQGDAIGVNAAGSGGFNGKFGGFHKQSAGISTMTFYVASGVFTAGSVLRIFKRKIGG